MPILEEADVRGALSALPLRRRTVGAARPRARVFDARAAMDEACEFLDDRPQADTWS